MATKTDRQMESSLSELRGREEHREVERALKQASNNAGLVSLEQARELERERCAKLCDQWPDNLMARHLAKLIRSGKTV
jgi:hypothetical protein